MLTIAYRATSTLKVAGFLLAFISSLRADTPKTSFTDYLQYVNILQGSKMNDTLVGVSRGNDLPLVGMPWGMVGWTIQNEQGRFFFQPKGTIDSFRATHQPAPWMGDYGQFTLMPQADELHLEQKERRSEYDPSTAILRPDYEKLDIKKGSITAELIGTERCGLFRFTFHNGTIGRLIINSFDESEIKITPRTIYGISRSLTKGNCPNFNSYFVIQLDRDISSSKIIPQNSSAGTPVGQDVQNSNDVIGKNVCCYVEFQTAPNNPVLVTVGTSFISWQQAEQNLRAETVGSFDEVHHRVSTAWNTNLAKIDVQGTEEQKKTFYGCLYRALSFPQSMYETDAAGNSIHYSPYDGGVHEGVLYGNCGIWDVFRTSFPLYTLLYPRQLDAILQGFLNAAKEGDGSLPEWPSPGYRPGMIGQHCAAIFADAIVKGDPQFDVASAYASLRKSAFIPPTKGMEVRLGLGDYLKLGYVTDRGSRYCVSTTLDYAYDDWCIAQIARKLNHPEDEKVLMARSQNYRNLWDPSVGFMRAKNADGTWVEPFDQFLWGGPYCEAGPWVCSWFAPHDPAGLASLVGGRTQFAAKLDQLFALPPTYHCGPGGYRHVIDQMLELDQIHMGQCTFNNQPGFHIPYLFATVGQPWKTEYWTRFACDKLFNSSPKGYCGDEDTGSFGGWYVWSSMGLYPFCPGAPEYIVTSPLFQKVTIHLPNGKDLVIRAPNNSPTNLYVQHRSLNGQEQHHVTISHNEIIQGGELLFEMGPNPKIETLPDSALPHSATNQIKN